MLNITVNWPLTRPPYPAAPDSHPIQGGEYTSLRSPVESCGTLVSTHSPTSEAGRGRWWRSHQRGPLFHRPLGRLPGFIIMAPPYFQKGAHHDLCPLSDSDATLGPCVSTGPYALLPRSGRPLREYRPAHKYTNTSSLAHYTIPVGAAFAGERPILSPVGQILSEKGALHKKTPRRAFFYYSAEMNMG